MKACLAIAICLTLAACEWRNGPATPHVLANVKKFHLSIKDGPGEIRVTKDNRTINLDQEDELEELHREWWESSDDDL
jgi:type IV pilus biogenesis protein CpaD/CtpE